MALKYGFFTLKGWLYLNYNLLFFIKMCILAHYLNYFWNATIAYSSYVTNCINLQNYIICVRIMNIIQFNNLTFPSTIVVLNFSISPVQVIYLQQKSVYKI